ncbi:MATE family efflux transporter [Olivibacter domesticus]|uniref:Multidrug-efflux transporter n=1 Tax=Olivibacter domesticus TaxID=407022 RepID=A0A1H7MSH8_OLID1|nr:MATE family efflux transporter [Olivibacter domesticus]SEL14212.1 putative efflux protein, MATE family [Olivibacter domesticus]
MLLKIRSLFNLFRIALQGSERNFTVGSVNRATFLLAVPTMLELSMESLFVVVDLLFVSSLGERAITIVGISNSVLILLQSVATGLGIAATTMIARRVGEQKPKLAGHTAMQVVYIGVFIGILCSGLAFTYSKEIVQFSGANSQLIGYGNVYTKFMFGGACLMIMRIILNGIFRGAGDAFRAMRALIMANFINAVLCALLIYGIGPFPALGIVGAGIAMVAANGVVVAYQLWHLVKTNRRLIIGKRQLRFAPVLMNRLIKLATAGTLQFLVPSSSRFLMIVIVAKLGESTLAGYILANRIVMFTVLPAWGIANAAGVLTGQNLGAKQPERAEESVWKTGVFNMCYLGLAAIMLLFYARSIVGIFTNDVAVLNSATTYLQYMAIAYFFFGYTMVISRALNASGAVGTVTLLNILMFYVTQLPLAYLLAITANWGANGIFIAIMFSEIVLATACVYVFRQGKWKQIVV